MTTTEAYEFFIQWHLTGACNLRCKHCYQDRSYTNELNLPEIAAVVDEAAVMLTEWQALYGISFAPSFTVTGGEPFLRQDLFEVLQEMRLHGFGLSILSNGTMITRERAKALSHIGVAEVQVSMEGPENVHNAIRGRGSFAAAVAGVQHLLEAGLRVTLNATLHRANASRFLEMIPLAASLGVHRLGYSRLVPSGRGSTLLDQMLTKDEVSELYVDIRASVPANVELVTGDPLASQMGYPIPPPDDAGSIPQGGCAAGVSGLTILPDGTITPCRRLPVPIGNVRHDSLREVWASSEVLRQLRDRELYGELCRSCSRWAGCRGCRAIAYAFTASQGNPDILASDPQCFISGD